MKRSVNKTALGILALIASVGTVHAETGTVEITSAEQKQAVVEELVRDGYLLPTQYQEWYQINHERLNDTLVDSDAGDEQARHTVNKLKALVGKDVDIKTTHIIEAHGGTQDGSGE